VHVSSPQARLVIQAFSAQAINGSRECATDDNFGNHAIRSIARNSESMDGFDGRATTIRSDA